MKITKAKIEVPDGEVIEEILRVFRALSQKRVFAKEIVSNLDIKPPFLLLEFANNNKDKLAIEKDTKTGKLVLRGEKKPLQQNDSKFKKGDTAFLNLVGYSYRPCKVTDGPFSIEGKGVWYEINGCLNVREYNLDKKDGRI